MHVVPAVRQGHSLTLTFQLPSLFKEYRAKPDDYVSHLLGARGQGQPAERPQGQGLGHSHQRRRQRERL